MPKRTCHFTEIAKTASNNYVYVRILKIQTIPAAAPVLLYNLMSETRKASRVISGLQTSQTLSRITL